MRNNITILGAGGDRDESDFYPTPPSVTMSLMRREKFDGQIWECASGDGSMSKVLEQFNKVKSSDIRTDAEVYGDKGVNFLCAPEWEHVDNIVTNPPYKFAQKFVEKSKAIATKKVAMLLKLVFLEGEGRFKMFQDTAFPLQTVYVFSKRQSMYKQTDNERTRNHGMIAYAWFVFYKEYKDKPKIEWIND